MASFPHNSGTFVQEAIGPPVAVRGSAWRGSG
jgi:hypothetical protein